MPTITAKGPLVLKINKEVCEKNGDEVWELLFNHSHLKLRREDDVFAPRFGRLAVSVLSLRGKPSFSSKCVSNPQTTSLITPI